MPSRDVPLLAGGVENLSCCFSGEFSLGVGFSQVAWGRNTPAATVSVVHVVPVRTCQQMDRIYACWSVANVADFFSDRNGAAMHFVGHAMGEDAGRAATATLQLSISGCSSIPKPQPAFIGLPLSYIAPKTRFDRDKLLLGRSWHIRK
jgi:hypothetical protein